MPELARPLAHRAGDQAVDADRGEQQRDDAESDDQRHHEPLRRERRRLDVGHALDLRDRQQRIDRGDRLRGCASATPGIGPDVRTTHDGANQVWTSLKSAALVCAAGT